MAEPHVLLTVNAFIALLSLWVGWRMYSRFYRALYFNEYRFRMFALRDRLTYLVMSGKIREGSEEHITLLKLINGAITATERFRITEFVIFLVELAQNKKLDAHIERIKEQLSKTHNSEYASIVEEFYGIAGTKLKKDTKFLRYVFRLFSGRLVAEERTRVAQAKEYVEENRSVFGNLASARV